MPGKRARQAKALVDRTKLYEPIEAIRLLQSLETAKFDETVEVHIPTGLNVRHADEQLRGTIALPHGLGRRVLMLAVDLLQRVAVDLAVLGHQPTTSTPIERAVPAIIFAAWSRSLALRSSILRSAICLS